MKEKQRQLEKMSDNMTKKHNLFILSESKLRSNLITLYKYFNREKMPVLWGSFSQPESYRNFGLEMKPGTMK